MTWNVVQTAEFLGLKPKMVRALAHRRTLPAVKLGKEWRFDETTLREWLQRKTRENEEQCPSVSVRARHTGKAGSNSLGESIDLALAQQTRKPPRNSRSRLALISGGKSDSANDGTPGMRP